MVEINKHFPIICGPTASGKSAAVYELATQFDIELVSVDSRQIFKYLDVGTGKPDQKERQLLTHHLIDIIEPGERYSSHQFLVDADKAIEEIISRNKVPVLVGGTGFYMTALLDGVIRIDQNDSSIRQKLEDELERFGNEYLHKRLREIDPEDAEVLHPNNYVRLIRALEIYELTGKTRTALKREGGQTCSRYDYKHFALLPDRSTLYEKINARVDRMLEMGWLEELRSLVDRGWEQKIRKSNVIGYTELLEHLNGNVSLDAAIDTIKQDTRHYAKRQYTWFRNQIEAESFDNRGDLVSAVGECVKKAI